MDKQPELTSVVATSETEKKSPPKKPSKAKPNLSTALTTFSHAFLLGVTIYFIILSCNDSSLFAWHPALLTVGYMICMAEAVMCLSPNNLATCWFTRATRVKIHLVLQTIGAALIFAGFAVVFIIKGDYPHFTTDHDKVGLAAIVCCGVLTLHGFLTYYSQSFKKWMRPIVTKLIHVEMGLIAYILGVAAELTGLYTGWFLRFGGTPNTQVIFLVVGILGAVLSLESSIRSAYIKSKVIFKGKFFGCSSKG